MRKFFFLLAALCAGTTFAQMPEMASVATNAQLKINRLGSSELTVSVSNPNASAIADAPVCIQLPADCPYKSATVSVDGKEIPSQMDDLNGDGIKDELSFVMDLKKKASRTASIVFSTEEAPADRYTPRVHAQMWFRDRDKSHTPKQHIPTDTVSERVDNMYSAMHHHGPAFESDQVAYRIYFDKKQSTDLYGKKVRQLELADGLWYSVENKELAARNFGDDIILVGQTISIGTLRGWDDTVDTSLKDAKGKPLTKMVMIDPFAWRQAHIVAKGPVRTVVDMNVEGWQYKGRTLNLKSRYILYAGNRECEVIQQFEGNTDGVEFVTGVIRVGTLHPDDPALTLSPTYWKDDSGTCASFGMDWADGNHELYPVPQRAGVACSVPSSYVSRTILDDTQVLYGIHTDRDNAVRYRISFCAPDKETFARWKNDKAWFDYVAAWRDIKPVSVVQK